MGKAAMDGARGAVGTTVSFRILVPGRSPGELAVIPAKYVTTEAGGVWFTQEGEQNSHFLPWHRVAEIERLVTPVEPEGVILDG